MVFVKNPVKGKVKTRIAQTVGNDESLRIYLELINICRKLTIGIDCKKMIYYSDFVDTEDLWPNEIFQKMIQVEGDLGIRMSTAMAEQENHSDKMILIGSDCPYLTKEIIHEAFKRLEENDVVLGPTEDGGYYLIGMKKLYRELFENKTWSTPLLYSQTLETLNALKLPYYELEILEDIDFMADWEKYLQYMTDSKMEK